MTVDLPSPSGEDRPSGGGSALHRTPAATSALLPGPAAALAAAAPWSGFAEAADAVLELLQNRLGMDLWAVTQVSGAHQEVLVARSAGFPIPAGAVLPWAESFCARMVAGAPRVAPRVRSEPAYTTAGAGERYRIGAYVGVPLVDEDGALFGTLCAMSVNEQPARLAAELPLVELLARQLSTLLAKERLAAERSAAAAAAYAVADRDPETGLLNARGWERAVTEEEARCARSGGASAVAAVAVAGGDPSAAAATAALLAALARRSDRVARTGGAEYAVLAADTGSAETEGWVVRVQQVLAAHELDAVVVAVARDEHRALPAAWRMASEAARAAARP